MARASACSGGFSRRPAPNHDCRPQLARINGNIARRTLSLTTQEAYKAGDLFLRALDDASPGAGSILKDQTSKDWMETSVLRTLARLDAAAYHQANIERLVRTGIDTVAEHAGATTHSAGAELASEIRTARIFSVLEIGFEIEAFLAAARSCVDFGGSILALHLGMNRRTSITKILDFVKGKASPPFGFLLPLAPWIESVKEYRDECVHYRTLRMLTGYETIRRNGVLASAIRPLVIPEEPGKDRPDTRLMRMLGPENELPVGLDRSESSGSVSRNGVLLSFEHLIQYEPASGYVRVEDFSGKNLARLCEFLEQMFNETLAAKFTRQRGT